jgi:transposase-like protein
MTLSIDPEFRELIPPLAPHELSALEAEIVAAGRAVDPIAVWSTPGGDIIVDGHHRHAICTARKLPFAVRYLTFGDRTEVKKWMLDHQLARRNLTPDQVCALAALRGVPAPADFGGLAADRIARELVAAGEGDALLPVLAGKYKVRLVWLRWRERTGQAPPRKPRARATPPVPTPTPLEAARAARAERAEETADKRAVRQALAENERLSAILAAIAHENATPLPAIPRLALSGARREGACIALLSDVHAGANVALSSSTFGNRYSPAIARYRLRRYFAGVAWHVRAYRAVAWDIKHLVLWFGGDMIDGHLHGDQQETSESPVQTIDWLEPILTDGARSLLELDLHVDLVCSYGNHGRDTIKPRRETGAQHSYEWGMYQRIARSLTPDGVHTLADPTAHQYHEVMGYTLHFTHGDETRYAGGVGGISIPLNKAFSAWDRVRHADYHHCGHYHTQLDGGYWIANGAVKGYDPFAMSVKGAPETPRQALYVLDAKRGKTAVTPLWVSDAVDEATL